VRGGRHAPGPKRANRVFKDKPGGLAVDYLGLAHELKAALATYTESGGTGRTALDQEEAVGWGCRWFTRATWLVVSGLGVDVGGGQGLQRSRRRFRGAAGKVIKKQGPWGYWSF